MKRENHGESDAWSIANRHKKSYGFDADVRFELSNELAVKQCTLVLECVEN